jgi:hypothetical protein
MVDVKLSNVGDYEGDSTVVSRAIRRSRLRLVRAAQSIDREGALEAGEIGFYARIFVRSTLPHRDPRKGSFERQNGSNRLSLTTTSCAGLPFGRFSRLLLAWICTEAVRTKSPDLVLGRNLSSFMESLGLEPTGGPRGTIACLRDQARRLFGTTIASSFEYPHGTRVESFRIVEPSREVLPFAPGESGDRRLTLTPECFASITTRPVPIDLRVLRALRSPLAIDVYLWSTWRLFRLRRPVQIPWRPLSRQFGSDYGRLRAFRAHFREAIGAVLVVYPALRVSLTSSGLQLRPSSTHVSRLRRRP